MKVTMKSNELIQTVALVTKNIKTKSSLPIFANIRVDRVDNQLRLTTANDTQQLAVKIPSAITSEEFAPFCVEGSLLRNMTEVLPKDSEVTWETLSDKETVLDYGAGKFSLAYIPAEEFPALSTDKEDETLLDMNGAELVRILKQAVRFTSDPATPRITQNVMVNVQKGAYEVAASDGHILFRFRQKGFDKQQETSSMIVTQATINLLRDIPFGEEGITLHAKGKLLIAQTNDILLTARLVDGKFPDVNRVIDSQNLFHKVSLPINTLTNAVKRILVCADVSDAVILENRNGYIWLQAKNTDYSMEAEEELSCSHDLDNGFKIGFNGRQMLSELALISTEEVSLMMADGAHPISVKEDYEDSPYTLILMPVIV